MNKDNLLAWAAALRSGNYEQGQDNLYSVGPKGKQRYCCLGVLCEINKVPHDIIGYYFPETQVDDSSARTRAVNDMIPRSFWQSITGLDPDRQAEFVDLNDLTGASFDQIASHIDCIIASNG